MRLKDRTLKNDYERRNIRENAGIIQEAGLDPVKMKEYENAVDKLKDLVPPQAAIFNKAIEDAKNELIKYIEGGVGQTIKGIFGKDPVAKAVNFANSIRAGIANIPALAKTFVPPGSEKETQKSFLELVPTDKQQQLISVMVKAFGGKLPYVANMTAAVQEMLQNTNPQGLYKNAQAAAAIQQVAPPPAQPAAQAANATGAQPTQASAAADAAKGSAPTTSATAPSTSPTTSTPKKITVKDTAAIADLANYLTKKVGLDAPTLTKVLTQLAKDQKLVG